MNLKKCEGKSLLFKQGKTKIGKLNTKNLMKLSGSSKYLTRPLI
jgi:hypothetical protein